MPVASLLAQQLGGLRVKRQQPTRAATAARAAPAAVREAITVAAVQEAVHPTRELLVAVQTVKTVAISDKDANKVLTFTLTDGSVETVVVESTADIDAKVRALAAKIVDLQTQAAAVATRLEAIEKVI